MAIDLLQVLPVCFLWEMRKSCWCSDTLEKAQNVYHQEIDKSCRNRRRFIELEVYEVWYEHGI